MDAALSIPAHTAPHSEEAERAALGAMLHDAECAREGILALEEGDFYITAHRLIFSTVKGQITAGRSTDLVTVKDELASSGRLADAGGVEGLMLLVEQYPSSSHLADYCLTIKEKAYLRNVAHAAQRLATAASAQSPPTTLLSLGSGVAKALGEVPGIKRGDIVSLADQAARNFTDRAKRGPDMTWGVHQLDEILGGIRRGETTVIGARTSQGKTSTTLNVVLANLKAGKSVLYVAFENVDQVVPRLAALDSCISLSWFLMPWKCVPEDQELAKRAIEKLKAYTGLTVVGPTPPAQVRAMLDLQPRDLVVCDYLQRASVVYHETDNRHVSISRAFSEWYDLARTANAAVLVLSQISRRDEKERKPRPPKLEELKESGDIENFADTVLLLWWRWRETLEDSDGQRRYTITVAKAKLGEPQTFTVEIEPKYLKLTG